MLIFNYGFYDLWNLYTVRLLTSVPNINMVAFDYKFND